MRRFTQILIILVIAILIIPLFLPDKINAEAELELEHPIGIVYEEFNNLKEFSEWEPWNYGDSTVQKEYFSPYRDEGAGYKWTVPDDNSLDGEVAIIKTEQNQLVEMELSGLNLGSVSKMVVEFTSINPEKTKVNWQIESKEIGYFSRYYSYFTSKRLKEKLEEGLILLSERLKSSALTPEQAQSLLPEKIQTEIFEGAKLITILNETTLDPNEINTANEESFGKIYSFLVDYIKVPPQSVGKPTTFYEYIDLASKKAKFYCGYPITENVKPEEEMELFSLPAGEALVYIHKGSYDSFDKVLKKMKNYAAKNKLKLSNSHWKTYLNDPEVVKDTSELLTKIYIPIN